METEIIQTDNIVAIAVDLDGTLCTGIWKGGATNEINQPLIDEIKALNKPVWIVTKNSQSGIYNAFSVLIPQLRGVAQVDERHSKQPAVLATWSSVHCNGVKDFVLFIDNDEDEFESCYANMPVRVLGARDEEGEKYNPIRCLHFKPKKFNAGYFQKGALVTLKSTTQGPPPKPGGGAGAGAGGGRERGGAAVGGRKLDFGSDSELQVQVHFE